jgi:S-adenosylmethionine decarboxylase
LSRALGKHILIDFHDCPFETLDDTELIRTSLLDAAAHIGATIVTNVFHRFAPQGVSGVVVIAESHLAIHTWPEFGIASIDLFSCSDRIADTALAPFLARSLRAGRWDISEHKRGVHTRDFTGSRDLALNAAPI